MNFPKLRLLVLILFLAGNISAKEYHVSLSGSDENNGTSVKPFLTIGKAAVVALPGDVITVHSGIYREQVTPPRGGNSDSERIVYQAAPGENVEIRGSEIIKGWKKVGKDAWSVVIPNSLFGKFNPYQELIHGDWFWPNPKDRKHHRGAVYLNGDWLMEAASKADVLSDADAKNLLWWAETDSAKTTIWAQFTGADPNTETVEINVRPVIFYPDKPFVNFITLRGFKLQYAATNWAPPTAEQTGLVGTHWSRGWIIENNTIQYSKCVGISLGKYGDQFDNKDTESAEGYVGTIKRALAFGWNKGTIGNHIVRNNTIAFCEQAGIVGSMGCAFSVIEGNTIHDIHIRRLFDGAEMAAIKFHGAIDVQITNNHIFNSSIGIWLDWMAQGAQIKSNLVHDNSLDVFLEVNHGPILLSNNVLLSKTNLLMNSGGVAFAHNLFAGKIDVYNYDSRLTPYHKPHSTSIEALSDNPGGDVQFVNNLFVAGSDVSQYSKALLPVRFDGNVYLKGAVRATGNNEKPRYGEMNSAAQEQMKKYNEQPAFEANYIVDEMSSPAVSLINKNGSFVLEFAFDKKWMETKRRLVSTETLGRAFAPQLPFENADESPLFVGTDFSGRKRNLANPAPGSFEITGSGIQQIKVW
jgi:alpha-N-arabinofuranosidase